MRVADVGVSVAVAVLGSAGITLCVGRAVVGLAGGVPLGRVAVGMAVAVFVGMSGGVGVAGGGVMAGGVVEVDFEVHRTDAVAVDAVGGDAVRPIHGQSAQGVAHGVQVNA